MRLGAHVFGYQSADEWAKLHIQYGYGATYWPLPLEAENSCVEEYKNAANRHGLVISEVGAWNNLLDCNKRVREKNLQDTINCLKLADRIGAKCCINIVGSYADTWDGPHPANLTEDTFGEIARIIRYIIDKADPQNTYYTVEPMPWLFPNSIESMQRLIKAVDRPHFAVHADMCNLINSVDKVYKTGEYTKLFFETFGSQIKAVHAKDTRIGQHLTMQIYEAIPGDGIFDYESLLTECAKLSPDLPVMVEHLEGAEEYLRATRFIAKKAAAMGLELINGCERSGYRR